MDYEKEPKYMPGISSTIYHIDINLWAGVKSIPFRMGQLRLIREQTAGIDAL